MKLKVFSLSVLFLCFANTTSATEYIYRDIMANTLPSAACSAGGEAMANAAKPYNLSRYSKKFCQSQGYGWHVDAVKDNGNVACQDCGGADNGKKKCHVEDVVVTCKRIKPGTVGMWPGKG